MEVWPRLTIGLGDLDLVKAWVRVFQMDGFKNLRKETWCQSIFKATVSGSRLSPLIDVCCTYTFERQISVVDISQSLLRDSFPLNLCKAPV